ncbi:LOW QUALITY PROTEIN: motilin receptor, partial [Synchiropus picturatus]
YRLWQYVPWLFGEAVCRLYHFVFEGCTCATILHITALSVERYLAISAPLRSQALRSRRRVRHVLLALWAFALASAAPTLFLVGVEYENGTRPDPGTGQCQPTSRALSSGHLHIMLWVSTSYFCCPMLLAFLYGAVGLRLRRSRRELRGARALARERSHRQTLKILVVLVLAFVICWLPYHVGRNLFAQVEDYDTAVQQNFNVASMVLCYLSASINPVVYNLMSRKYRAAARRLFRRRRPAGRGQRSLSTLDQSLTGV